MEQINIDQILWQACMARMANKITNLNQTFNISPRLKILRYDDDEIKNPMLVNKI